MRVLVVHEAKFGNARDVVDAVTAGLCARGTFDVVDVVEVRDAPRSLEGYDLLVLGGPTTAWIRRDERSDIATIGRGGGVREWVESLALDGEVLAAVFDTKVEAKWFRPGALARPVTAKLREHGLVLVTAPEHFLSEAGRGPLLPGELQRARRWGGGLSSLAHVAQLRTRRSA